MSAHALECQRTWPRSVCHNYRLLGHIFDFSKLFEDEGERFVLLMFCTFYSVVENMLFPFQFYFQLNFLSIPRKPYVCSFCYRHQNEQNDFPFIPKTE